MSKSNQEIIIKIVKARAAVLKAGIIFDDESLDNVVDAEAFFKAEEIMVNILRDAIVVHAELMSGG